MSDDFTLLREFVERGSEDAFRTLVNRHSGMVHAAARRIVHDTHQAQEITQAVFVILARKGKNLHTSTILAGWLYRTARFVAMEAVRAEQRRQRHHEEFAQMNATATSHSIWNQIAPILDEVMDRLRNHDRDVIVLRFLEDKAFSEVGSALGISEASAKMRVSRALEKLRSAFARRGIVVPAATLFATLSAHSATAAPAGLSASVATIALAGESGCAPTVGALVKGALKGMAWGQAKSTAFVGGLTALLIATIGIVGPAIMEKKLGHATVFVTSLDPMVGEWEGIYESRSATQPIPTQERVVLTIKSKDPGRSWDAEMHVSNQGLRERVYHFTHVLSESRSEIEIVDDPQIGRLQGAGAIQEHFSNPASGNWRVTFYAPNVNRAARSEIRWIISKRDELLIDRHDQISLPVGAQDLFSRLILHRRAPRPTR